MKDHEEALTLEEVGVDGLDALLRSHGWTRDEWSRASVWTYAFTDDRGRSPQVILPHDAPESVSRQVLAQAVDLLHTFSGLEPDVARDELKVGVRDHIVFTLSSSALDVAKGVPFVMAADILSSARELLVQVASAEEQPRPGLGKARKVGREFVDRCRFEHTEAGSFRLVVAAPPLVPDGQLSFDETPPFDRRVVERLLRGAMHVERADRQSTVEPLIEGWRDGFGANALDAVGHLLEATETVRLDLDVAWSGRIASREPSRRVQLRQDAAPYLQGASEHLRVRPEERLATVKGR